MVLARLLLILVLASGAARADVSLAPLFSDHAVLQAGKPVRVWGSADPGDHVSVRFQGQEVGATADPDGSWAALLSPLSASARGSDLVAAGRTTAVVHDVLVGEVWLCSGQSNMEFVVFDPKNPSFQVQDAPAEIAAARYPLIRQFAVRKRVAGEPADSVSGGWTACSPETVGRFTAVGYFFARAIHRRLGVPVGIINSTWGGTPVESWMSPAALGSNPDFSVVGERWKQTLDRYPGEMEAYPAKAEAWEKAASEAKAAGPGPYAAFQKDHPRPARPRGPGDPWTPSGLFNGMIAPLAPFSIRGALWYQGESNAGRPSEYHRLFAAMITAWRAHFGQGNFPFYWVQLAGYGTQAGRNWAFLREAQAQTLSLPETGQAVTIDIGEPDNIHPRNKQEVGRRLALIAKARVYGIPGDDSGPVFAGAVREGPAMRVRFLQAQNGLTAGSRPLQSFELAGADRVFHPAAAAIERDTVVVRSAEVAEPVAVRYAWCNAPEANLFNGSGLPAGPFRSDAW